MAGNRKAGVILQDRDRHLLSEVGVMRIVDREMAKLAGGFHSTRRANARLLQLTRARLLRRFFVGSIAHGRKAVYTLSPKGTELVDAKLGGVVRPSGRLIVGDRYIEHQAGINEVYLTLKYRTVPGGVRLIRWLTFQQSISDVIKLTPDAYFEIESADSTRAVFLEVDLGTEALSVWQKKVAYYLQLAISGEFQRRFRQPQFRVLVIVNSERRFANVRATVAKITDKIFWFTTFEDINREDFWSTVWLRPTSDQRRPLL